VCKKLIKNSQPFGKKFQKTVGGDFFWLTLYMFLMGYSDSLVVVGVLVYLASLTTLHLQVPCKLHDCPAVRDHDVPVIVNSACLGSSRLDLGTRQVCVSWWQLIVSLTQSYVLQLSQAELYVCDSLHSWLMVHVMSPALHTSLTVTSTSSSHASLVSCKSLVSPRQLYCGMN